MFGKIFGWIVGPLVNSLLGWITGWLQRRKLVAETKRADRAEAEKAQDEQVIKQQTLRHDIEQQIANEPDAPPQRMGDADPASAAGKLRGFERD